MNFLAPLAFALATLLPVIIALYFLKLRREEMAVSSVYLWQEMVRDVAANAPWQRLRPNLLLLLQLLFLVALTLALARPFAWTMAASGDHAILVVDTSASMAATDVDPSRMDAAADQARQLANDLPPDVPVTLIVAGDEAQVRLSASRDRGQLGRALDELRPGGGSDMATALELAAAVAAGEPEAQVIILSDGGVRLPDRVSSAARMRYVPIGESAENQAISALSLNPGPAGQGLTAFVRVTNYGSQEAQRRLMLYAIEEGEQRLVAARDLALPAGEAVALTIPDLPPETVAIEAHLEGEDTLPTDDRAWAIAPLVAGAQVQIVGPGNRFLETALALLPGVEVTTLSLEDYEALWDESTEQRASEENSPIRSFADSPNWLTIFDTVLPEEDHYPPGALLFVGPLRSTDFFSVTGAIEMPISRPASAGDPLLSYVDLRDTVIQRAARLTLPTWGRPVIVASSSAEGAEVPLLVVGEIDGRRLAALAFDLRQSDLPLRPAFPLLLANLVDSLVPGTSGVLPEAVAPGRPVAIPLSPQAEAAIVTRPDGAQSRLQAENGMAYFEDTLTPGVYQVAVEIEGQPWLLGRFAVNAYSPLESDIAPRRELSTASTGGQTMAAERPARQEWWRWLAWGALALLVIEWLVQYRGALAWLWSKVVGRGAYPAPREVG